MKYKYLFLSVFLALIFVFNVKAQGVEIADDCLPITTLPFMEGFEGETFPPLCWTRHGDNTQWERNTAIMRSGLASAGIQIQVGGGSGWLVTQPVTVPDDGGHYVLKFWSFVTGGFEGSQPNTTVVSVSTEGNDDISTFEQVKSLTNEERPANTWREIIVPLSDKYAGETIYIGFMYQGTMMQMGWYIDELQIEEMSAVDAELVSIIAPATGTHGALTDGETVKVLWYQSSHRLREHMELLRTAKL